MHIGWTIILEKQTKNVGMKTLKGTFLVASILKCLKKRLFLVFCFLKTKPLELYRIYLGHLVCDKTHTSYFLFTFFSSVMPTIRSVYIPILEPASMLK